MACDVAIVGGGLVGAGLAAALAPLPLRVVVIEAAPPPRAAPAWDERMIGLNEATRRIFESLGVWDAIAPEAEPILATHISERGRFGVARFTAAEAGLPALGYNTPMRAIAAALQRKLETASRVSLRCPATLQDFHVGSDGVRLELDDGQTLGARLLVAADGAESAVRRHLGIGAQTRPYGQSAVISAVRPERPHHGVAYERFTTQGPIAVLPRPDGCCTVVWMVASERAADVLAWDDAQFLAHFHEAFGNRLGRFLAAGRRQAFPLQRVLAGQLTAPRVVFVGNAAQTLHPVAAQGFNLGLRDAATLAELLEAAPDPGAGAVLQDYAARRADDRSQVAEFTDRLVRTFSNDVPGLRRLRHWGLLALDLLPPAKAHVMRQSLGYGGRSPALARGVPRREG